MILFSYSLSMNKTVSKSFHHLTIPVLAKQMCMLCVCVCFPSLSVTSYLFIFGSRHARKLPVSYLLSLTALWCCFTLIEIVLSLHFQMTVSLVYYIFSAYSLYSLTLFVTLRSDFRLASQLPMKWWPISSSDSHYLCSISHILSAQVSKASVLLFNSAHSSLMEA